MRADSPDQWKSSFFCHCSILFSLLAPLGPQFGVSAFPHRQPHRYVSKCPLPSPESVGEKENDTHETHFSQSVIRNMDRATGKARTRHKLISSVSPFPLTVWVALAVTCYLADKREVRLQNQIWCRIRSTVQQPCWRIQNKAFQIALLTDQTLKGDHDMFLVWWNAGPRTDRSDYHVWNLSKQRKCHKTHLTNTELVSYEKNTLSRSWVLCWTNAGRSVEFWIFPSDHKWLIQWFWVVCWPVFL